jgi:phosphoenolpyruvate-protein phosphotransferase
MKTTTRKSLQGHPITNGLVIGRIAKTTRQASHPHTPLIIHASDSEWQKYNEAQKKALQQIEELRRDAIEIQKNKRQSANQHAKDDSSADAMPEVMSSYSLLLTDEVLTDRIRGLVFGQSLDATSAVLQAFRDVRAVVEAMEDQHIREKVLDLDACEEILLSSLSDAESIQSHHWAHLRGRVVVVQHPSPNDIIRFHQVGVAGIIAEAGSHLSHAAILARSFNIPTVFGAAGIVRTSSNGQMVILDAHDGKVTVNPSRSEQRKAEARRAVELMMQQKLKSSAQSIARTIDGQRVIIFANANGPVDSRMFKSSGAEGIGLLRTEFLHLNEHSSEPSAFIGAEEQLKVFFQLTAENVSPGWATFRLLDCGGDKPYPPDNALGMNEKQNVSEGVFGLRGIRFLLAEQKILELQLRSLLRANIAGNVRILVPYVTDVTEMRRVKAIAHSLWLDIPEDERTALHYPKFGAMIETPAAVQMTDHLASECDFMSIGSNDLTQHYLCVERDNSNTQNLYNAFHPALLRCIHSIFEQQKFLDVGISLCGELASDPIATELLIGLGCVQLSCRTSAIPLIKEIIRKTDADEARRFAEGLLRLGDAEEIQLRLKQRYDELHGRLLTRSGSRNRAS